MKHPRCLCVARDLICNNYIVYGGDSAEISCSGVMEEEAKKYRGVEQVCKVAVIYMLFF